MKKTLGMALWLWLASGGTLAWAQQAGFTQEDRERMVRMEERSLQMEKRLGELHADMNQRFEQMQVATDQRFEQMQVATDRRFGELREDMNQRFGELREDMNQRFGELRHDMNQRFEQVMLTLQIIAAVFTAFFLAMLGYAWWDRRTIIRKAREDTLETLERNAGAKEQALVEQAAAESIRRIEREGRLSDLILALRQHASTHPAFADDLKAFRLL